MSTDEERIIEFLNKARQINDILIHYKRGRERGLPGLIDTIKKTTNTTKLVKLIRIFHPDKIQQWSIKNEDLYERLRMIGHSVSGILNACNDYDKDKTAGTRQTLEQAIDTFKLLNFPADNEIHMYFEKEKQLKTAAAAAAAPKTKKKSPVRMAPQTKNSPSAAAREEQREAAAQREREEQSAEAAAREAAAQREREKQSAEAAAQRKREKRKKIAVAAAREKAVLSKRRREIEEDAINKQKYEDTIRRDVEEQKERQAKAYMKFLQESQLTAAEVAGVYRSSNSSTQRKVLKKYKNNKTRNQRINIRNLLNHCFQTLEEQEEIKYALTFLEPSLHAYAQQTGFDKVGDVERFFTMYEIHFKSKEMLLEDYEYVFTQLKPFVLSFCEQTHIPIDHLRYYYKSLLPRLKQCLLLNRTLTLDAVRSFFNTRTPSPVNGGSLK
jgi:hypothetical protein